jgi:hypothetical protein
VTSGYFASQHDRVGRRVIPGEHETRSGLFGARSASPTGLSRRRYIRAVGSVDRSSHSEDQVQGFAWPPLGGIKRLCPVNMAPCNPSRESDMAADVEKVIKDRLREIDEQIVGLDALRDERERLSRALEALGPAPSQRAASSGRAKTRRRTRSSGSKSSKRAARGTNQRAILDHVQQNPGATTPQIAEATGIDRSVIYSAVSRMTTNGRLTKRALDDGQVAYDFVETS